MTLFFPPLLTRARARLCPSQPGKPELGIALTYRGGDTCLKRVVSRAAPNAAALLRASGGGGAGGGNGGDAPAGGASSGLVESWVPTPRQLTLRLRCDPSDAGGAMVDPAAAMLLSRRVRVFETEMCKCVSVHTPCAAHACVFLLTWHACVCVFVPIIKVCC
jgi:hypothetical protein